MSKDLNENKRTDKDPLTLKDVRASFGQKTDNPNFVDPVENELFERAKPGEETITGSNLGELTSYRDFDVSEYEDYFPNKRVPLMQLEELNKRRAQNQSWWEQTRRGAGNIIFNAMLTVTEDAGQYWELAFGGKTKDYDNALIRWAQSKHNPFGEVYREDPSKVWDIGDYAWWVNNAGELVSSIGAFAVEGYGIGSALGAVAKGGAKLAIKAGAATKLAGASRLAGAFSRLLVRVPKVATSAMLSYAEMARTGAEVYQELYNKYSEDLNPNDAAELASKGASETVLNGTLVLTALNMNIVSPFFKRNSNSILATGLGKADDALLKSSGKYKNFGAKQLTQRADETLDQFKKRLKDIDIKGTKEGRKWLRGRTPLSTYGTESFKEGIEEVVTAAAGEGGKQFEDSDRGWFGRKMDFWGQTAKSVYNADNNFAQELLLNFALGAVGGGGHMFINGRMPTRTYKRDAEGNLIAKTDKDGNILEGQYEKKWMTVNKKNRLARQEIFEKYRNSLIKDFDLIEEADYKLKQLATKGDEAQAEREEITDQLFDMLSYNSITLGATKHLISSFEEIAAKDNTVNLGTKLIEERNQLLKELEQEDLLPEVREQKQKTIEALNEEIDQKDGHTQATFEGYSTRPGIDGNVNADNQYQEKAKRGIEKIQRMDQVYQDYAKRYEYGELAKYEFPEFLTNIEIQLDRAKDMQQYSQANQEAIQKVSEEYQLGKATFDLAMLRDKAHWLTQFINNPSTSERHKQRYIRELKKVQREIEKNPAEMEESVLGVKFKRLQKLASSGENKTLKRDRENLAGMKNAHKEMDGRTKKARKLKQEIMDLEQQIVDRVAKIARLDKGTATSDEVIVDQTKENKRILDEFNELAANRLEAQQAVDDLLRNESYSYEYDRMMQGEIDQMTTEEDLSYFKSKEGMNEFIKKRTQLDKMMEQSRKNREQANKTKKDNLTTDDAVKINEELAKNQSETKTKETIDETKVQKEEKQTDETTKDEEVAKETKEEVTEETVEEEVEAPLSDIEQRAKNAEAALLDALSGTWFSELFGEKVTEQVKSYISDVAYLIAKQPNTSEKDIETFSAIKEVLLGINKAIPGATDLNRIGMVAIQNIKSSLAQRFGIDPESLSTSNDLYFQPKDLISDAFNMINQVKDQIGSESHIAYPSIDMYLDESRNIDALVERLTDGEFMKSVSKASKPEDIEGDYNQMMRLIGEIVLKTQSYDPNALTEYNNVANYILNSLKESAAIEQAAGDKNAYSNKIKAANEAIRVLNSYYEGRLQWDSDHGIEPIITTFKDFRVNDNLQLENPSAEEISTQEANINRQRIDYGELKNIEASPYSEKAKKTNAISIANKAREFDPITRKASEVVTALSKESMHMNNVGDKIRFEVDEDYDGIVHLYEGDQIVKINWQEAVKLNKGKKDFDQWYQDHVPIQIYNEQGDRLGSLHQLSWVNKYNIGWERQGVDNVEEQRRKLKDFRKWIIQDGLTEGVITTQGPGFLNASETETLVGIGMPKILSEYDSLGIASGGKIYLGDGKEWNMTRDWSKLLEKAKNMPIIFVPAPNGEMLPVVANRLKINGSYPTELNGNTEEIRNVDNTQLVVQLIRKAMKGEKIGNNTALELLEKILYVRSYNAQEIDDDIQSERISVGDNILFAKKTKAGKIIEFKTSNEKGSLKITKETAFDNFPAEIEEALGQLLYNLDRSSINQVTHMPFIDKDGNIFTKEMAYNEYFIDKLATNVRSKKLVHNENSTVKKGDENVYEEDDNLVEYIYTNNNVVEIAAQDSREVKEEKSKSQTETQPAESKDGDKKKEIEQRRKYELRERYTVSKAPIAGAAIENDKRWSSFSQDKIEPLVDKAIKKLSEKIEKYFEGTLSIEGIETHFDLMKLVSTDSLLKYWKQNAKDALRRFLANKANGTETRTLEEFLNTTIKSINEKYDKELKELEKIKTDEPVSRKSNVLDDPYDDMDIDDEDAFSSQSSHSANSNPITIGEEPTNEVKETIRQESLYHIPGVTAKEMKEIITYAVGTAYSILGSTGGTKTSFFNALRDKLDNELNKITNLVENDKIKGPQKLKHHKRAIDILTEITKPESFNKLAKMIDDALTSTGYRTKNDSSVSDNELKNMEDPLIKEEWNDNKRYEVLAKDTLSYKLKSFLSDIKVKVYSGERTKEVRKKSPKKDCINMARRYNADKLLIDLFELLHDEPADIDHYINVLRNSGRHDYLEVAHALEGKEDGYKNDDLQSIRNAFVMGINKAENVKYILKIVSAGENTEVSTFVSNREKFHTGIMEKWYANQFKLSKTSSLYKKDEEGNIEVDLDELTKKKKVVQNFYNEIMDTASGDLDLFDLAERVSKELLEPFGVNLEVESLVKLFEKRAYYMKDRIPKKERENAIISLADLFYNTKNAEYGKNIFYAMVNDAITKASDKNFDNKVKDSIKKNNPLATRAMRVLAEVKYIEEAEERSAVFVNSEGNQETIYAMPTMLSDILKGFKNDPNKMSNWLSANYSKRNVWINGKQKKAGFEYMWNADKDLVFGASDAMTKKNDPRTKIRRAQSPTEREFFWLNNFINQNSGTPNRRTGIFSPLVFSDKSRNIAVRAPRIEIPIVKGQDKFRMDLSDGNKYYMEDLRSLGSSMEHALLQLAYSEIDRFNHMRQFRDGSSDDSKQSEAYVQGSQLFYLFPEMNNDSFQDAHVVNGKIDIENSQDTRDAVKQIVYNAVLAEVNETIGRWYEHNIVNDSDKHKLQFTDNKYKMRLADAYEVNEGVMKKDSNESVNAKKLGHLALEYVSNYLLVNGSMTQLIGDVAMLHKPTELKTEDQKDAAVRKGWDTYYKRLGGVVGTRMTPAMKWTETVNGKEYKADYSKVTYIYADDVYTNRYGQEYQDKFNVAGYDSVIVTDAQEFTTLKEHITNLYGGGKIKQKIYESINQKIIDSYRDGTDIVLSEEEIISIIPQKPLFTGQTYDDDTQSIYFDYVKSSSIPLIPEFTSGTQLDAIRKKMESLEKEQMYRDGKFIGFEEAAPVRLAFKSAVKSGARNINTLFKTTEKGYEVDQEALDNVKTNVLKREGFGFQQEESGHSEYQIYPVSQMNKLITSGILHIKDFKLPGVDKPLSGEELRDRKAKIKIQMMERGRSRLHGELGIRVNPTTGNYEFTSLEKVQQYIIKNSEGMGLTANELEGLKIINGQLAVPLYLNNGFNKMISSLMSAIHKRVLRPKINGMSYVQTSSIGYQKIEESKASLEGTLYTEAFDGKSLKYYRKGDQGIEKVQVLVSREYLLNRGKNKEAVRIEELLTEKDGNLILDKDKVPKELLTMIGARIPNQGHSSMIAIEIAGFLPENMHETIIVPDEITAQMGSDFDIDHIYNYAYNFETKYDIVKDIPASEAQRKAVTKTYKEFINQEITDDETGEVGIRKEFEWFKEDIAKIKAASAHGLWYEKSDGKLYTKAKNYRLQKITRKNQKNVTKEVLDNEYIDIHNTILTHPQVVSMVLKKLDMEDTGDFVKENKIETIVNNRRSKSRIFNPLGMNYNMIEFDNNLAGKDGVAIQSNYSMLMSLLEDKKLYPRTSDRKRMEVTVKIDGINKTFNALGRGEYTNSQGEKRTNADVISMLQTEAVDNAKNKLLSYLGYNTAFSGVYNFLTFLTNEDGAAISMEFIASFMLHPVVADAHKAVIDHNNLLSKDESNISIQEVVNNATSVIIDGDNTVLSQDLLLKSLKGELSTEEDVKVQSAVAKLFRELYDISEHFEMIYRGMNDETKGVGKDLNAALRKRDIVNNYVLNNERIDGTEELMGHMGEDGNFVFTTEVGKSYQYGTIEALNIWGGKVNGKRLNVHLSNTYQQVHEMLKTFKPSGRMTEKQMKFMEKGMIDYIMTNSNSPLFGLEDGVTMKDFREQLQKGEVTIAEDIDNYLTDENNEAGRTFLQTLVPQIRNNVDDPTILKFNSKNYNKLEEGQIIDSFLSMLLGDEASRELGLNLMRYAVASGWTFSPTTMSKLIPMLYVLNTDMQKFMSETNLEKVNPEILAKQLMQHDPRLAAKPHDAKFGAKGNHDYLIDDLSGGIEGGKDKAPYKFVYKKGNDRNMLYELYGTSGNKAYYKRVSNLSGEKSGLNEYDFDNYEAESIIPGNNPAYSIEHYIENGTIKDVVASRPLNETVESTQNPAASTGYMIEYFGKPVGNVEETVTALNKIEGKYKGLADYIMPLVQELEGLSVSINTKMDDRGRASRTRNVININPQRFEGKTDAERRSEFEETLVHELIHLITHKYIDSYLNGSLPKGRIFSLIKQIEKHRNDLKEMLLNDPEIGSRLKAYLNGDMSEAPLFQPLSNNLNEFITGVTTNREFLEMIKDKKTDEGGVIDKIIRLMKNLYNAILQSLDTGVEKGSVAYAAFEDTLGLMQEIKVDQGIEERIDENLQEKEDIGTEGNWHEYKLSDGRVYRINDATKEITTASGNPTKVDVRKEMEDRLKDETAEVDMYFYNGYNYEVLLDEFGVPYKVKGEEGKRANAIMEAYTGDNILDVSNETKEAIESKEVKEEAAKKNVTTTAPKTVKKMSYDSKEDFKTTFLLKEEHLNNIYLPVLGTKAKKAARQNLIDFRSRKKKKKTEQARYLDEYLNESWETGMFDTIPISMGGKSVKGVPVPIESLLDTDDTTQISDISKAEEDFLSSKGTMTKDEYISYMQEIMPYTEEDFEGDLLKYQCS